MHGGDLAHKVRQVTMTEQLPTQAHTPNWAVAGRVTPKRASVYLMVFSILVMEHLQLITPLKIRDS